MLWRCNMQTGYLTVLDYFSIGSVLETSRHREKMSQVFILDEFIRLSNPAIFPLSFLSRSIFSATRLQLCDPLIPQCQNAHRLRTQAIQEISPGHVRF